MLGGVLDHQVILPSGDVFHNPMRVVPNGEGSEVLLTIYRGPEMSETEWVQDAAVVRNDLLTLKQILEAISQSHSP